MRYVQNGYFMCLTFHNHQKQKKAKNNYGNKEICIRNISTHD